LRQQTNTERIPLGSERSGEHTRPGVVPGVLAGHKARICLTKATILLTKPLPRFVDPLFGADAEQLYARTRVLPTPIGDATSKRDLCFLAELR
jgi:hypothetical protein